MHPFNRLSKLICLTFFVTTTGVFGVSEKKPFEKDVLIGAAIEQHLKDIPQVLTKSAFKHIKYNASNEQLEQLYKKGTPGAHLLLDTLLHQSKKIAPCQTDEEFLKIIGSLASLFYLETVGLYHLRQLILTAQPTDAEKPGFNKRFDLKLLERPRYSIYDPCGLLSDFFEKNISKALREFKSSEKFVLSSLLGKRSYLAFGSKFIHKPCPEFGRFDGFTLTIDRKSKNVIIQLCENYKSSGKPCSVETFVGGINGLLRAELILQPQTNTMGSPHKTGLEQRNAILRLLITLRDYLTYSVAPNPKMGLFHDTSATTCTVVYDEEKMELLHGLFIAVAGYDLSVSIPYILDPLVCSYVIKACSLCKLYHESYSKNSLDEVSCKKLIKQYTSALIHLSSTSLEQDSIFDKEAIQKKFSNLTSGHDLINVMHNEKHLADISKKTEWLKNIVGNFCNGLLFDYNKPAFALSLGIVVQQAKDSNLNSVSGTETIELKNDEGVSKEEASKEINEKEIVVKNEDSSEQPSDTKAINGEVINLSQPSTIIKKKKNLEVDEKYLEAIEKHAKLTACDTASEYFLTQLTKALVSDKTLFKPSESNDELDYDFENQQALLNLAFEKVIQQLGSLKEELLNKKVMVAAQALFTPQTLVTLNSELSDVNDAILKACVEATAPALSKFCVNGDTPRILGLLGKSKELKIIETQLKSTLASLLKKLLQHSADKKLQPLFQAILASFEKSNKSTLPFTSNEKIELLTKFRIHLKVLCEQSPLQDLLLKEESEPLNQENKLVQSLEKNSAQEPLFLVEDYRALLVFVFSSGKDSTELSQLCVKKSAIEALINTYTPLMQNLQKTLGETIDDIRGFRGGCDFLRGFDLNGGSLFSTMGTRLCNFIIMQAYKTDKKLQSASYKDNEEKRGKRILELKTCAALCEKVTTKWEATHIQLIKILRKWGYIGARLKRDESPDNLNCQNMIKACYNDVQTRFDRVFKSYQNLKFSTQNFAEACVLLNTIKSQALNELNLRHNIMVCALPTSSSFAHLQMRLGDSFQTVLNGYPVFYSSEYFGKKVADNASPDAKDLLKKLLELYLGKKNSAIAMQPVP